MLPAGKITEDTVTALGGMMGKRRHHHRRRQHDVQGRHPPGRGTARKGHRLCRCRHVGRRVGAAARLLHDDRRRGGSGRSTSTRSCPRWRPASATIDRTPGREGRNPTAEQGYLHCGPAGSGHFVKMVHNGIEYGMMQAYAEGFDVLRNKNSHELAENERFDLNMGDIAEVWRRGSVVSSWLLDLTASALAKDEKLASFSGDVSDSGEGRWTIDAAVEEAVPVPVLASLAVRPLPLAAGAHLRREDALGDALRLRRPRRTEGLMPMSDVKRCDHQRHGRSDSPRLPAPRRHARW